MKTRDAISLGRRDKKLSWDGDNAWFVLDFLLPNLNLSQEDKKVVRWAYANKYEQKSDGETVVKDVFLDGKIKSPAGVTHDYVRRVWGHKTPDGHVWTAWESNALYRRIQKALGGGFRLRWRRWAGLTLSIPYWWHQRDIPSPDSQTSIKAEGSCSESTASAPRDQ